jgi:molecular chaperone GrpE
MSDDVDAEESTVTPENGSTGDADEKAGLAADAAALAARAAEYDDGLAAAVRDLAERVEDVEAERDAAEAEVEELSSQLKRKQADFQNYKKRTERRQEQLEERATEAFVSRVVSVRDNLVRALDQDDDSDLRDGLEGTLAEFDRILGEENVDPIEPEPGDDVDPERHEVLMRVESDQPAGTVVDVYRPGYEMADKVIQTAQVTVSDDE